jgi:hypothetical protein
MRRMILAAGVSGATLALAACYPPHPHHEAATPLKVVARLDCPDSQGDLSLKSQTGDGKSCAYGDSSGALVNLQLISLASTDARTALAPLEADLRSELPSAQGGAGAAASGGSDKDRVDIDLPGIHIHAKGDGDATVDAAGVKVNANNAGAHVEAHDTSTVKVDGRGATEGVTIDAGDKGAEIRVNEAGSGERSSFILASDSPGPHGYKFVGYEARGPVGGPLVVASVRAKEEDHDDLRHDMRALLRRNVGG